MQDIKQREFKMQEARKNTPWRDFVKEICSWQPVMLYKNNGIISIYPQTEKKINIVHHKSFSLVRDNLIEDGEIYNTNKSFLENIRSLFSKVPLPNLNIGGENENADFCDIAVRVKNAYLSFNVTLGSENVCYSLAVRKNCKNIMNSIMVRDESDTIYSSIAILKSFKIFFSEGIFNSSDIWFSSNLIGCHECLLCNGLENKSYCIENKVYDKNTYTEKKQELLSRKDIFKTWSNKVYKTSIGNIGENNSGNGIFFGEGIENGYYSYRAKNCRNIILVGGIDGNENMKDMLIGGFPGAKDYYGINGAGGGENMYNSNMISFGANIYYCYGLEHCNYCLGCIGLKNKSFCILNKQYTKEERFEKANDIFAQMEKDGTLGKFFPASMNPFYFNDTVAYLIDDTFTKEEVTKEGYLRRDEEIKVDIPEGSEIVLSTELDKRQGFDENGNRTINPEILKKVIKDPKGNAYRIVKMEYGFLMKYGLPLPELHWLDRIKLGFKFK